MGELIEYVSFEEARKRLEATSKEVEKVKERSRKKEQMK